MKSRPYQQGLLEALKDTKEAMAYLEAALDDDEEKSNDYESRLVYLKMAVKNVIEANKKIESYTWVNVYQRSDGSLTDNIYCGASEALVGRLKVKLERRFDDE